MIQQGSAKLFINIILNDSRLAAMAEGSGKAKAYLRAELELNLERRLYDLHSKGAPSEIVVCSDYWSLPTEGIANVSACFLTGATEGGHLGSVATNADLLRQRVVDIVLDEFWALFKRYIGN